MFCGSVSTNVCTARSTDKVFQASTGPGARASTSGSEGGFTTALEDVLKEVRWQSRTRRRVVVLPNSPESNAARDDAYQYTPHVPYCKSPPHRLFAVFATHRRTRDKQSGYVHKCLIGSGAPRCVARSASLRMFVCPSTAILFDFPRRSIRLALQSTIGT